MARDYPNIGRMLADMSGHGVYHIDFVTEQVTKYGFVYDEDTDTLAYGGPSDNYFAVQFLGAKTKSMLEKDILSDPKGGVIDDSIADDALMFDAVSLSRAIHKLLMPGKPVPSGGYYGRGKGFRADTDSIINYFENPQLN